VTVAEPRVAQRRITYIYMYMCVYMCICICVYVYILTYIYVYILHIAYLCAHGGHDVRETRAGFERPCVNTVAYIYTCSHVRNKVQRWAIAHIWPTSARTVATMSERPGLVSNVFESLYSVRCALAKSFSIT